MWGEDRWRGDDNAETLVSWVCCRSGKNVRVLDVEE
jgi:hypothetical protein